MKDWIFSEDATSIENIVAGLLNKNECSLTILECLGGGLIAKQLSNLQIYSL